MLGISFAVGASPGAWGLELASVAFAAARTGRGTGCELAGLGSRLEGDSVEAVLDDGWVVLLDDGVVEDFADGAAGASDWAWAIRPGAMNKSPASKARAAHFRV
jgi:hypothetical protein